MELRDGKSKVGMILTCPKCDGSGSWPFPTRKVCDLCNGLRSVDSKRPDVVEWLHD